MSADDTQPSSRITIASPRFARVPLGFIVISLLISALLISCMVISLVLVVLAPGVR
jgi:hypothetical protein